MTRSKLQDNLRQRAQRLKWILLDVDGVLTQGTLVYSPEGEMTKHFHVRDGLALKLAQRCGLRVGLLSGRESPALSKRASELKLDEVMVGRDNKDLTFTTFLSTHHLTDRQVAYIGDDLPDLPVLLRVGLSFAPADAAREVRERVHHVLETPGGHGAAREMIELLLRARGEWDDLIDSFLPSS